jgi:hypothetical protein
MADKEGSETPKEPYVSQGDRPEVRLKSDTPLTDLTVRDLATLLGRLGPSRKDFWDGTDWAKNDFDGPIVKGKEFKDYKDKDKEKEKEKEKDKDKREKLEKPEHKELKVEKIEKIEADGVFEPVFAPEPDPRLDRVIEALSGLETRVAQLADQVEELKKSRDK